MNQCLKISFVAENPKEVLDSMVKQRARDLGIEGTVQALNGRTVNIVACSNNKEILEAFLDLIHREAISGVVQSIAIEPFLKNKDYRGVFRVIE